MYLDKTTFPAQAISVLDQGFVEQDAGFLPQVNRDYDDAAGGITLESFARFYGDSRFFTDRMKVHL